MKKALIGFVVVGVAVGMRPVARRISHEMREHCEQMAARCNQMAARAGDRREAERVAES